MQFDLGQVDTKTRSEDGVDMPVKLLSGAPLIAKNGQPVSIVLLGPDSKKYKAVMRRQVKKRLDRKESPSPDEQIEEAEQDGITMLVACTLGWKNVLDIEGKEIAFSAETARILYGNYPVIADQVDLFVTNRANFLLASSAA